MDFTSAINDLEIEITQLKELLIEKETSLLKLKKESHNVLNIYNNTLSSEEVTRYSRQMLVPQISLKGQIHLKNSKVLIVGAGGLGSPSALYLAAAGIGEITIVDSDCVELSNLHRQIMHSEMSLGIPKVKSAHDRLKTLNGSINIFPLEMQLNSQNVMNILDKFDVVIDGSDNVATRYMLNDSCVIKKKPLVSGSALQMEGQLTVYNYKGGPCYRCVFPVPPPPETIGSCGDNGVLGVVPGTIGVLQALETIKIITSMPDVLSGRLLLFDACDTTFRNVKLRKRNLQCVVCGDNPTVLKPIDYEQFCRSQLHDKVQSANILHENERINVEQLQKLLTDSKEHILIDVRSRIEFEMCKLNKFVNIPYADIQKDASALEFLEEKVSKFKVDDDPISVYFICRRGNDSQRAVQKLRDDWKGFPVVMKDVVGGLHEYSAKIDSAFPVY